jgi:Zn-dependent protease
MNRLRIGSVFGLELTIDWSWFIILALLLWSFSAGVFPARYPQLAPTTHLLMGIAASVLFFASLLAHELAHSLVARRRGVPVQGITLFVFGGVARMRREPATARDEALIAGIGPLVSLLLAAGFGLLAWTFRVLHWSTALSGVAGTLGAVNLSLAIFNLLPGLPLDGGRLLRALVWGVTQNAQRATRVAATGGRVIGLLLTALGIALVFFGNLVSGLWLVLIGSLIRSMAVRSYAQQLMAARMAQVTAAEVMSPRPETVRPLLTLVDLVDDYFRHGRHLGYPVASNGHALGLVTLEDVKGVPREEWPARTVEQVMAPAEPISIPPDASLERVIDLLEEARSHRVLVQQQGELVGIITPVDVAHWVNHTRRVQEL